MFEAIVTLCLTLSEGPCRAVLLPGYEAPTASACYAALARNPPDLSAVAAGPPVCELAGDALDVQELAPGVFAHMGRIEEPDTTNRGDVSNLGFVIGNDSVAVIDSGSARWVGEALYRAIRARTDKPVSHVILTHMHPDHVFGASVFASAGAVIVGHAGLSRALADRQANYLESLTRLIGNPAMIGTGIAPVDLPVVDELPLDLGGRRLVLHAMPTAHTGTDLVVLDQTSGTLFTGDLVFDRHTPALDGSLIGWRKVLTDLADLDVARIIVPGHGGPVLDWPDGAADTDRYLQVLEADTRAAIKAGERLGAAVEHIAESERGSWDLFDAFNARNATVAFTELEWD